MTESIQLTDRVPLAALAAELGVSPKTIIRWADIGYDGHRLASFRLGKRRFTSRQAAEAFVAAINGNPARVTATGCC